MDDRELLQRYRHGDAGAFEQLLDRHECELLRYAESLTGDPGTAQDIVQDAFLALIRFLRRKPQLDSVAAWLFRVVRNRSADCVRREIRRRTRHRAVSLPEACGPAGRGAAGTLEIMERDQALARELQRLDPAMQEVLTLKIQAGKSYREIAAITGFSLGKISELTHKGLKQLSCGLRAAGVV